MEKAEKRVLVCTLASDTKGKERKRQATPDGELAGLISKGTYQQGLSSVASQ